MHLPGRESARPRADTRFAPWRWGAGLGGSRTWHRVHAPTYPKEALGASRSATPRTLYDEACSLLAAAQGLRAAAGPRGSVPAIAASLGCIEASLEALATAITVMRVAALERDADARPIGGLPDNEALKIRASFEQLARDLSMSRSSCARAREITGPVLAPR